MRLKTPIKTTTLYAFLAGCLLASGISAASPRLVSDDTLKQTSIDIVNQLKLGHYRYLSIDDEFSSLLFDKYLEQLDPTRSYLLSSDVKSFEKYRYNLDNDLNRGDLEPAFAMFMRNQERAEARLQWLIATLNKGIGSFDFKKEETLESDRTAIPWADSEAELDELWRKRLKNSILNLKLADKKTEDIAELLIKRYKNQLNRLNQTNAEDAFQAYMNIVTKSYDPHTEYLAPRRSENFNINMSLSLEGIGAVLQSEQEYTKVVRLIAGGPADLAGELGPADKIVGVGQGDSGETVDVIGWRLDEVVDLIRGKKGTTVRLDIISSDAENNQPSKQIKIVRNKVLLEEQAAKSKIIDIPGGSEHYKVGVIEIPTFYADFAAYQAGDPNYKSTTRDVAKLLRELQDEKVDGIVIDLRNNGGGSLNEANALIGLFIKSGATVQVRNARGKVKIFADNDPGIVYDGPLAVMINRLSASASEIFAGAMQDYQRGIVVGGQTFGKGTVQTLIRLNQGQLKITQAKFYRISGESTQHEGVHPDIALPPLLDPEEIGENTLDGALPWDTIRPVLHKKVSSIAPHLEQLNELHQQRVKDNPDYQFRLKQIERLLENRKKTSISLNEQRRLAEIEESKAWQLALENQRRTSKNLPAVASLSDLDKEPDAVDREVAGAPQPDPAHADSGQATAADNKAADDKVDEEDPYLVEGSHILVDLIRISSSQLAQQ